MSMVIKFPSREADLLTFLSNFNSILVASGVSYGLTAGQVSGFTALFTAYETALVACEPDVRSKPAVVTKNLARDAVKTGAFNLAMILAVSSTVTPAQKLALGITPRATPTPIPTPSSAPAIEVVSAFNRTLRIRLHDAASGVRRGMPTGVSGVNVFSFVGATPPEDIGAWKFEGGSGKSLVDVNFDGELPAGTKVWLTAFWFNGRKKSGPATTPVGAVLPGGGVSVTA
jgi:hypothetical protein